MNNTKCCSYRLHRRKLERGFEALTAILRLLLLLLQIWTLISG